MTSRNFDGRHLCLPGKFQRRADSEIAVFWQARAFYHNRKRTLFSGPNFPSFVALSIARSTRVSQPFGNHLEVSFK